MNKYIVYILFAFFILFTTTVNAAYAATLSFDPASYSTPLNETFQVKLTIDTQGEDTTSTDAVILFDSSILAVISIQEGDNGANPFYPDLYHNISPGNLYIGASVKDPIDVRSGTGVIATITFKGINTGTSDVKFDCTVGKTSDTNISKSDKNQTDIVNCATLTNGRYTVGGGIGGPTPQPIQSPPLIFTPTPTPTLFVAGNVDKTVSLGGLGILFITGAIALILLKK